MSEAKLGSSQNETSDWFNSSLDYNLQQTVFKLCQNYIYDVLWHVDNPSLPCVLVLYISSFIAHCKKSDYGKFTLL